MVMFLAEMIKFKCAELLRSYNYKERQEYNKVGARVVQIRKRAHEENIRNQRIINCLKDK